MKKNHSHTKRKSGRLSHIGIFLSLMLILQVFTLENSLAQNYQQRLSDRSRQVHNNSDTVKRWLSWNILFHENASDEDKNNFIIELETKINHHISAYNNNTGRNFKVDYHVIHCPCDPRLSNINATKSTDASGYTQPPPPPKTGGSADIVSLNNPIDHDPPIRGGIYADSIIEKKVPLTVKSVDKSKILAVMDTGLDPDLFGSGFNDLLWSDPDSNITIRNFQFYHNMQPPDYSMDDNAHIHGTAVTTIALQEFEKAAGSDKPKPSIMVLKVLDEEGKGNTFSVSCGLSYAVQKKATLVNASLGYYSRGKADAILLHYVGLCNSARPVPIPILAAAGNVRGVHNANSLCNTGNNGNELTKLNTFDPASFSKSIPNVISITTIQNPKTPCFYQNYSSGYVNVGVVNGTGPNCCKFPVPFLPFGYEGSSFATPFVSGKMMACMMDGGTQTSCRYQWSTAPSGTATITRDGKYLPN